MKSNHAAAAAAIRAELKRHGIKASVRSESYSGGSSITVDLQQDLSPAAVAEIKGFCNQYVRGSFDGMTDCYHYDNTRQDLPQVSYVFVNMDYSEEAKQAARDYVAARYVAWNNDTVWAALYREHSDFWKARKPRVRAAA